LLFFNISLILADKKRKARQTRNKKNRTHDEEMSCVETNENAEDSNNDITPSTSSIITKNRNSEPTELPMELPWKIYNINEKA